MKTADVFIPPVRLTPPDPTAAAVESARAALDQAQRVAGIAAADLEQARNNFRAAERAAAEETARRQKEAEEEAAQKSAAERAAPLHARADELAEGIVAALRWISGALSERSRLNSEVGEVVGGWSTSHIRVLPVDDPTKGRFSQRFLVRHD